MDEKTYRKYLETIASAAARLYSDKSKLEDLNGWREFQELQFNYLIAASDSLYKFVCEYVDPKSSQIRRDMIINIIKVSYGVEAFDGQDENSSWRAVIVGFAL